jgi:hypothetical protein
MGKFLGKKFLFDKKILKYNYEKNKTISKK